MWLG